VKTEKETELLKQITEQYKDVEFNLNLLDKETDRKYEIERRKEKETKHSNQMKDSDLYEYFSKENDPQPYLQKFLIEIDRCSNDFLQNSKTLVSSSSETSYKIELNYSEVPANINLTNIRQTMHVYQTLLKFIQSENATLAPIISDEETKNAQLAKDFSSLQAEINNENETNKNLKSNLSSSQTKLTNIDHNLKINKEKETETSRDINSVEKLISEKQNEKDKKISEITEIEGDLKGLSTINKEFDEKEFETFIKNYEKIKELEENKKLQDNIENIDNQISEIQKKRGRRME